MEEDKKINSRVAGCLIKLACFVLMVVAFMALVFFLFSGLTYFLEGEPIELPKFSKMWDFVTSATDDFFNKVDDGLNTVESAIGKEGSQLEAGRQEKVAEEGALDWRPDTVILDGQGGMMFTRTQA